MGFWDTVKTKYIKVCDADWKKNYFLRNPERKISCGPTNFLSPADGTLLYFKENIGTDDNILQVKGVKDISIRDIVQLPLNGCFTIIGLFLSFWDIHFQRMPTGGTIQSVKVPCRERNSSMVDMENRLLADNPPCLADVDTEYMFKNERVVNTISTRILMKDYYYILVQIADEEVNVIDLFYPSNTNLQQGQQFGVIRFGSQVDILLPHPLPYQIRMNYKVGDHIEAGSDVLFNWEIPENEKNFTSSVGP